MKHMTMFLCCLLLMAVVLIPTLVFGQEDSLNVTRSGSGYLDFTPRQMAIQGQTAYVISDLRLHIFDIGNPAEIHELADFHTNSSETFTGIAVSGDYVYLGVNRIHVSDVLLTINISDLENITIVSEFRIFDSPKKIVVAGDYAYLLMYQRFQVFDISDPENPEALGYSETIDDRLYDLAVVGNYAYIFKSEGVSFSMLFIMDITNPNDPEVVSTYRFTSSGVIAVEGEYCYVVEDDVFHILDIMEPHLPIAVASMDISYCNKIDVKDGYCYVAGATVATPEFPTTSFVDVINVQNPEQPAITGYYSYPPVWNPGGGSILTNIYELVATTEYCYVLQRGRRSWIDVLDCSQALPVPEERQETLPPSFSLVSLYPNPFNSATTVNYSLPFSSEGNIQIFNPTGRLVQEFSVPRQSAGVHQFFWDASGLASGTYFLRVAAGNSAVTRQAVLLK